MKINIEHKRIATIITSLIILAISIIMLVVFLVLIKNNSSAEQTILRIKAEDIVMLIGETREDYYDVNVENAYVNIDIDNEGIIDINNDRIVALKSGQVKVTLTAVTDGSISKDTFTINVMSIDYEYELIQTINCQYEDNILYANSNVIQFNIELYDLNGEIIQYPNIECSANNGAILDKQMSFYILVLENDCELNFYVSEIDFSFTIDVILM